MDAVIKLLKIFRSVEEPTLTTGEDSLLSLAQREYHRAQESLRRAQRNFDNAEPSFIAIAVEDLNIAYHNADNSLRKLRMLMGITTDESAEPMPRAWLAQ